jgi:hypothetical protein
MTVDLLSRLRESVRVNRRGVLSVVVTYSQESGPSATSGPQLIKPAAQGFSMLPVLIRTGEALNTQSEAKSSPTIGRLTNAFYIQSFRLQKRLCIAVVVIVPAREALFRHPITHG